MITDSWYFITLLRHTCYGYFSWNPQIQERAITFGSQKGLPTLILYQTVLRKVYLERWGQSVTVLLIVHSWSFYCILARLFFFLYIDVFNTLSVHHTLLLDCWNSHLIKQTNIVTVQFRYQNHIFYRHTSVEHTSHRAAHRYVYFRKKIYLIMHNHSYGRKTCTGI